MVPTPEPVAPELADRLTLISAADPVDEVALRRFVADANRLMSADAATGHQLLGRVAALRWDVHEVKRRHRLSVSLGDPVLSRCNFAHSLSIVGLTDDAFEVALEASEHAPDDLFALNVLINAALANGRLRDAQTHLNRWRKLSSNNETSLARDIDSLVVALDQGLFSQDGVLEILRLAATIQINARARCDRVTVSESFEEPGSFLMTQYVIASASRAVDLNCELADRWAESPALQADPGLQFKPMFIGTIIDGDHA